MLFLLAYTYGLFMVILWLIPIYSFYDTAIIIAVSDAASSKNKATVIGALHTTSLAGSLVIIAGPLTDLIGVELVVLLTAILQIIASLSILAILNQKIMIICLKRHV